MRALGAVLAVLGGLALAGGVGLFVWVIFVRTPDISEGGTPVATVAMSQDRKSVELVSPVFSESTAVQPRVTVAWWTKHYVTSRRSGVNPDFRIPARLAVTDSTGRRLHDAAVVLRWETTTAVGDHRLVEARDGQRHYAGRSEYRLRPPLTIGPGTKLTVRFELREVPELSTERLGGFDGADLELARDVADVVGYHDFGAEAPMWGIYSAGAGFALVILGGFIATRAAPRRRV